MGRYFLTLSNNPGANSYFRCADYQFYSTNMSKLDLLRGFICERLTTAALEIFGAVEKTFSELQEEVYNSKEESARLKRLLDIVTLPEIEIQRTGRVDSNNATYFWPRLGPTNRQITSL